MISDISVNFTNIFSNREIAVGLWTIPTVVLFLSFQKARYYFLQFLKTFFAVKIQVFFLSVWAWSVRTTYLLWRVGYWELGFLKSTLMWGVFAAPKSSFDAMTDDEGVDRLKCIVRDNFTVWVLIEFLGSAFTFSLLGEVLFVPIMTLIVIMSAVTDLSKKYRPLPSILHWVLIIIGWAILILGVLEIFINWNQYRSWTTLKEFFIPPLLSVSLSVFLYPWLVYSEYEKVFIRMTYTNLARNGNLQRVKVELFRFCRLNIRRLAGIKGIKIAALMKAHSIEEFRLQLRQDNDVFIFPKTKYTK